MFIYCSFFQSKTIAKVSSSGVVEASILGSTTLTARAVGTDRLTGKPYSYSEDSVEVHVVKLQAVRIHTPITR